MSFNERLQALKEKLRSNLTAENTDLFTELDKDLDKLSEDHTATETKLTQAQDKIIEIVKSTSFKTEGEPSHAEEHTDKIPTIDEAFSNAFSQIEAERNKK